MFQGVINGFSQTQLFLLYLIVVLLLSSVVLCFAVLMLMLFCVCRVGVPPALHCAPSSQLLNVASPDTEDPPPPPAAETELPSLGRLAQRYWAWLLPPAALLVLAVPGVPPPPPPQPRLPQPIKSVRHHPIPESNRDRPNVPASMPHSFEFPNNFLGDLFRSGRRL